MLLLLEKGGEIIIITNWIEGSIFLGILVGAQVEATLPFNLLKLFINQDPCIKYWLLGIACIWVGKVRLLAPALDFNVWMVRIFASQNAFKYSFTFVCCTHANYDQNFKVMFEALAAVFINIASRGRQFQGNLTVRHLHAWRSQACNEIHFDLI